MYSHNKVVLYIYIVFRGFSYVDLVEETTSHKVYALKRLTCHSVEEEKLALQEVEVMKNLQHPNLVPLVAHSVLKVGHHSKTMDIVSEVFIVMPLYPVSMALFTHLLLLVCFLLLLLLYLFLFASFFISCRVQCVLFLSPSLIIH